MRLAFRLLAFVSLLAGVPVVGRTAEAPPFPMNGWQFHEHDFAKIEEAINRAPDYGVNFFIFSHEPFRSVEGFLASTDDADPARPPAWTKELFTPEYFRIERGWQTKLNNAGDLAPAKRQ